MMFWEKRKTKPEETEGNYFEEQYRDIKEYLEEENRKDLKKIHYRQLQNTTTNSTNLSNATNATNDTE